MLSGGNSGRLERYGTALLALAAAGATHTLANLTVGITWLGVIFLYLMATLIASWRGLGPGLMVVVLVLLSPYLYRPNFHLEKVDPFGIAVLIAVSLITSRVAAWRRQAEAALAARVREKTAELEEVNERLQQQLAELEVLYSKVPAGLCFLDRDLRFIKINEQLAAFNGLTVEEHLGRTAPEVLPADLATLVLPACRQALLAGERLPAFEVKRRYAGRSEKYFLVSCSPVAAESGDVLGLQVIVQDITAQKEAELAISAANRELRAANSALARANDDLAQFAWIAAHDLQEPLRTVVTFSQLIERRYRSQLDDIGSEQFGYVISACRRMSQLIGDVLSYSRVSLEPADPADVVNLDEALTEVLQSLQAAIVEAGASVTFDTLPKVTGNRTQIVQVLTNLVSNALKYKREDTPLRVHIAAARNEESWTITVADNGQGFRQEYAERIFGIFRRLHGQDVPGSGIGLAICKRLVERNGGRIWAESEEGSGATFHFTLPAAAPEVTVSAAR